MRNMVVMGVIAGSLAAAASAFAFGVPEFWDTTPRARQGAPQANASSQRMMAYDLDKDGKITRPEVDASLSNEFGAVDSNRDGRLDAAEIQLHADNRRAERRARDEAWRAKAIAQGLDPQRPPFDRSERDNIDSLRYADWNLDGAVTPDEFGGRARAQFMRADRNGDGMITADELKRAASTRRNTG